MTLPAGVRIDYHRDAADATRQAVIYRNAQTLGRFEVGRDAADLAREIQFHPEAGSGLSALRFPLHRDGANNVIRLDVYREGRKVDELDPRDFPEDAAEQQPVLEAPAAPRTPEPETRPGWVRRFSILAGDYVWTPERKEKPRPTSKYSFLGGRYVPVDEEADQLVERIAQRVAELMAERR